jgi:hypothetical protein
MNTLRKGQGLALLALGLSSALAQAAIATTAATFDAVSGPVQVQNGTETLNAGDGTPVQAGETIHVGTGSARLRTADRALIELGSNTDFQVVDYSYAGSGQPGESRPAAVAKYRLTRGTVRAVSGTIDKQAGDSYTVSSPEAELHVQGTDYSLQEGKGLLVMVTDGLVSVANDAGKIALTAGQYAYVAAHNVPAQVGTIGDSAFNTLPPIIINISIGIPTPPVPPIPPKNPVSPS